MLTKFLSVQGLSSSSTTTTAIRNSLQEVAPRIISGEVKYLEDIAEGLENAPKTFPVDDAGAAIPASRIVKLV